MPVIAITGGLGSGKSTVRKIFEKLGATGIDADSLAREVVKPGTEGARRVREAFGEDCFDSGGRLDREKMAAKVFRDTSALRRLESILHPLIRQMESKLVAEYLRVKPGEVVVVEIPLLHERHGESAYDGVVLVITPENTRLERLLRSGRYKGEDVRARMKVQTTDAQRVKIADWTVDNGGTLRETENQVKEIYRDLKSRAGIGN